MDWSAGPGVPNYQQGVLRIWWKMRPGRQEALSQPEVRSVDFLNSDDGAFRDGHAGLERYGLTRRGVVVSGPTNSVCGGDTPEPSATPIRVSFRDGTARRLPSESVSDTAAPTALLAVFARVWADLSEVLRRMTLAGLSNAHRSCPD